MHTVKFMIACIQAFENTVYDNEYTDYANDCCAKPALQSEIYRPTLN